MIEQIRKKLTLGYTVVIALFLTVCIGCSYGVYRYKGIQFVRDSLQDYLQEEIREAETQIRAGIEKPEVYKVASDSSAHNFSYWFVDGKILHAEEPQNEDFASILRQRLMSRHYQNNKIYHENIKYNKQKRYYILLKQDLWIGGTSRGEVFVLANFTSIRKSTKNYIVIALWIVLFAAFLAWFLGNILVARSMKYIEQSYQKQKQFVSDAAHEFRTPLTILYSYAELLEYAPKKKKIIAGIKDEVQQMNELIDRLLAIARYDNANIVMHREKFLLNELAASVVDAMSGLCPSGTFKLSGAGQKIELFADEVMIRQLLGILLDNAIKYTGENKKIAVKLSRLPSEVKISVEDNGIGIKKEDIVRVFDRFWQAETSRHKKGLGLGLSLADAIVKLHKGRIFVRSEPGKGSVFEVVLPLK